MRLLIDCLIAVMLVGILAGVLLHHRARQQETARLQQVRQSLARLHEQAVYHGALRDGIEVDDAPDPADLADDRIAMPRRVDRAWFGDDLPRNALAGLAHPWIDVAPRGDLASHPPDPILRQPGQAGFWYNPAVGVFRARIPPQLTEQAAVDLYNRLNNTALTQLPHDDSPVRQPVALESAGPPPVATDHNARSTPASGVGESPGDPPSAPTRPTLLDRAAG